MLPGAECSDWRRAEIYDLSALPKEYSERCRCLTGQQSPDERRRGRSFRHSRIAGTPSGRFAYRPGSRQGQSDDVSCAPSPPPPLHCRIVNAKPYPILLCGEEALGTSWTARGTSRDCTIHAQFTVKSECQVVGETSSTGDIEHAYIPSRETSSIGRSREHHILNKEKRKE